jgi:hypothetical protein
LCVIFWRCWWWENVRLGYYDKRWKYEEKLKWRTDKRYELKKDNLWLRKWNYWILKSIVILNMIPPQYSRDERSIHSSFHLWYFIVRTFWTMGSVNRRWGAKGEIGLNCWEHGLDTINFCTIA